MFADRLTFFYQPTIAYFIFYFFFFFPYAAMIKLLFFLSCWSQQRQFFFLHITIFQCRLIIPFLLCEQNYFSFYFLNFNNLSVLCNKHIFKIFYPLFKFSLYFDNNIFIYYIHIIIELKLEIIF